MLIEIIFIIDLLINSYLTSMNGETITGIALVFLSILFLYAGTVNNIWAIIIPADFLILAIGCAFIVLGVVTSMKHKSAVRP